MTTTFDRETLLDALTELANAPADMLLAMKLNAARGSRDRPDISSLLVACDVESTREADAIFTRYYPGEEMKDRGRAQLVALFREGD
jgi:hypothetical protein